MNSTEQPKQDTVAAIAESRIIVSKKEAASKGLKRYFTGKPCKRGHVLERLVSTGSCVSCSHATRRGESAVKKVKGYWLVRENIVAESKKYKTKSEMKRKNNPAYNGMYKLKLSDLLFPLGKKSNGYWSIDKCIDIAKTYSSISSFSTGDHAAAYNKLCKYGLIIEATSHMSSDRVNNHYWSIERCREEAAKYSTRKEFSVLAPGAYDSSNKNNWLNDVCSHMISGYKTSDCVYVWKVSGFRDIYKIGLTKKTIVSNRIEFVERSNNIKSEHYVSFLIKGNAHQVEQEALMFGDKFTGFSGDGYTEFRVLSACQYKDLVEFIKSKT